MGPSKFPKPARNCSDPTSEIYSRRFGRRETANSVIGAIAIEGFRRTRRVGERDIGVWPEQIDGVARQAGRLVLGSPAKNMQRHLVTGAPSRQLGSGGAIDMHLPVHRCQRFEIVLSIDQNPRQPVAAVNMTRSAGAERAAVVIQGDLRNSLEEILASCLEGH